MIALEENKWTKNFKQVGEILIEKYGKPKAILMVSAHWYTKGLFVQGEENPKQVYDMYGFPDALYQIKYPVKGYGPLSQRVMDLLGDQVLENNEWGIDHGAWTVLVHMFPEADIPVVQLSVDADRSPEELFLIGEKLSPLREEGYLIMASGNIVHNLYEADFSQEAGDERALVFDRDFMKWIKEGQREVYLNYHKHPHASFAAPTSDHLDPIFYALGALDGDKVEVFNQEATLNSLTMTSYFFSPLEE